MRFGSKYFRLDESAGNAVRAHTHGHQIWCEFFSFFSALLACGAEITRKIGNPTVHNREAQYPPPPPPGRARSSASPPIAFAVTNLSVIWVQSIKIPRFLPINGREALVALNEDSAILSPRLAAANSSMELIHKEERRITLFVAESGERESKQREAKADDDANEQTTDASRANSWAGPLWRFEQS